MKTTLKNNPDLMPEIINIQNMYSFVDKKYNAISDFKRLKKLDSEQLDSEQSKAVFIYNSFLKNKFLLKEWSELMNEFGENRLLTVQSNFREFIYSRIYGNYSIESIKHVLSI